MERERSIEALSILFTGGIAAGAMVSMSKAGPLGALLPALFFLPLILREKAPHITVLLFFPLGVFCSLTASFPAPDQPGLLTQLASQAAEKLVRFIGTLPFPHSDTAPLVTALVTGDRSGLSPEITAVFRQSGASHLLALSGLHMGILYLLLDKLTLPLGKSPLAKGLRYGLLLSGAAAFTLMSGASPSVVRAFLFIAIDQTLRLLHRPHRASRVLCLALLVQLVLDPTVLHSIGFQLSYLAMTGIFLLYPVLEKWYPDNGRWNPMQRIWQVCAISISCQVFTGPLAWYRFHTFPRYFLLTNLLAIPVTTLFMGSAVTTLLFRAAGLQWELPVQITDSLCQLLLQILGIIASL